jgi:hypothetical protein
VLIDTSAWTLFPRPFNFEKAMEKIWAFRGFSALRTGRFRRLQLSRNFWWSYLLVLWPQICKRLRSLGIDSKESIPPAYVAWRDGRSDRVVVPVRLGIDSRAPWKVYKYGQWAHSMVRLRRLLQYAGARICFIHIRFFMHIRGGFNNKCEWSDISTIKKYS